MILNVDNHSLSPLPHPVRVAQAMPQFDAVLAELLESDWPDVRTALMDGSFVLLSSLNKHANPATHPYFRDFIASFRLDKLGTSTEQGALLSLMFYLRHLTLTRPHFVVDDNLVELLLLTDIADDVPVSYLIPPYEGLYLELGRQRTNPLVVPNMVTGAHILEGAYIEQGLSDDGVPHLELLLVGSPVGKDGPLDDSTLSLSLSLEDPDKSLSTALKECFTSGQTVSQKHGIRHIPASFEEPARDALLMIVKVLLYLNLPDVRKEVHSDRSTALKEVERLKSPAKRTKALRRAGKTYDYVLISSAPSSDVGEDDGSSTKEVSHGIKAHFRRGHLRMQAYGPKHSLRKMIHIKPMRVGQPELGSVVKNYVVK